MFVLRRITSENVERNTSLGENYVLIDEERNPADFKKSIAVLECDIKETYGFISYNEGGKLIPLYKKSTYFIMTGGGQTFANITYKK